MFHAFFAQLQRAVHFKQLQCLSQAASLTQRSECICLMLDL